MKVTKKTIENLLIECRELLANKIFPLAENELVESHVSSSFEFGYICGALRYRELTDGDNALEREIERYEEELHGFESLTRADCINIARHFYDFGKLSRPKQSDNWKPSEEQMDSLMRTITWLVEKGNHTDSSILADLRRELQKLI